MTLFQESRSGRTSCFELRDSVIDRMASIYGLVQVMFDQSKLVDLRGEALVTTMRKRMFR